MASQILKPTLGWSLYGLIRLRYLNIGTDARAYTKILNLVKE